MQSVFYILQNTLNDCSASEKCIGEYIIANSPAVLSMTISELAKEANGSTAAVIRLCKRLNIDGFQELKILLAKDVYSQKKETTYSDFTFSQEDGTSGILDKVLHMNQVNLENISKVLNPSSIDTAVKKINDARFVHIAGVGASALPALDLHQKLSRIGKLSVFEQDSQMQMTAACTLTCDDVAVIFSYSGETDEVIKGAKIAKKEGAFCIAVTHAGGSALSKLCDVVLCVPFTEPLMRYGAILSKINQLIVVDILYTCLIVEHKEKYYDVLEKTRQGIQNIGE